MTSSSSFKFLYLLVTSMLLSVNGNKMSWCAYWEKRGVNRVECQQVKPLHWSLNTIEPSIFSHEPLPVLSVPICDVVTDWSRCQRSNHCPLGLLCWRQGSACCTPQQNERNRFPNNEIEQCPHPSFTGIKCNVQNPINWCNTDDDCHRSSKTQKCCPSGCGYNICVSNGPRNDFKRRTEIMSFAPATCLSMDLIDVKCVSNGISWCHTDNQCFQNGVQQRSCCPTRCGYNVCLLKLSANKWIIA